MGASDLLSLDIPVGARVLVVSDLLLRRDVCPGSVSAVTELAKTIDAWAGPGVIVVAGNLFDLLADGTSPDPRQALAAHPRLAVAFQHFQGEGRRVVVLPGARDARLAWDERAAQAVAQELGAELALAVELHVATGGGSRLVRVEPGHRFDPRSAPIDPHNPADTPLAHHVAQQVLPVLGQARSTWLLGADRLANDADLPRFVASRLLYRRVARHAWWLLVPIAAALLLKVPLAVALLHRHTGATMPRRLVTLIITTVVDVVVIAAAVYYVSRRAWAGVSGVALGERGQAMNDAAKAEARRLITSGGATGLITGHTRRPELTHLGSGFYANCGSATELVDDAGARLGLPAVFLPRRELSWLELEAGADLHVRLLRSRMELPGGSWLERLLATRDSDDDPTPAVQASFPQGESWPPVVDPGPPLKRTRRLAAAAIALAGVLNVVSALTPPMRDRLKEVTKFVPLAVPQAATALVAFGGLSLLLLSRAVRRGQRGAWRISVILLAGSVVLHVLKGADLEESVMAAAVLTYLLWKRKAFQATADRPSIRRGITTVVLGAVLATLTGTLAIEVFTYNRGRLPLGKAFLAAAERLVGDTAVRLPDRIGDFLTPGLAAVGIALVVLGGWLVFRPVVSRRHAAHGLGPGDALSKAREIVRRFGRGTLDYFALRGDKEFFFDGNSVVAYAVYGGVCLVSPDPIGPEAERDPLWHAFRNFADAHGWTLAVLGAGEEWLPVYRAAGMHDLYVGDEAVVDVRRFSLEGGRNKSLRQAVNRIAKYGYTLSFHDPAHLDPVLQEQLRDVMTKSRQGDVERGFSMTLGRVFEPDDHGLLLAVAHGSGENGAPGEPVAFCQYVPAAGIEGYSLDLMRRDQGEHPNGLIDFIVAGTIDELKRRGMRGLSLNFATMRAVLAGEAGDSLTQRVEAWILRRMSDSMQIESLWKFNAKFEPDWQPRYAVYDSPEHLVPVAMAIAKAESFWELPVIGRFLVPAGASAGASAGGPESSS
ncbi:MAG TPA: phosphatidylglycerol lysyltransferase domain-containing protein [Acidimicrobiales bacterium]|nr:phosphatidylglycerol lysyltransferase domain-containing protein [Acidimicrobiales bacterium]